MSHDLNGYGQLEYGTLFILTYLNWKILILSVITASLLLNNKNVYSTLKYVHFKVIALSILDIC